MKTKHYRCSKGHEWTHEAKPLYAGGTFSTSIITLDFGDVGKVTVCSRCLLEALAAHCGTVQEVDVALRLRQTAEATGTPKEQVAEAYKMLLEAGLPPDADTPHVIEPKGTT